jgi:putative phosphonate metabolism protein
MHRVALYFAPLLDDPLHRAAATWLGRDPATGSDTVQPDIRDIDEVTREPRLYGFHATLKPPMRLADGCTWDDIIAATAAMADCIAPFDLPLLSVQDLFGFLALRETTPCAPLQALADACVEQLDHLRAPPSNDELERRRRSNLTARQDANLVRWGYPYVFDTWFFHMTLTRRLNADEKARFMPAAEAYFADAIAMPRRVTDICLFTQPEPGAPFMIRQRLPLRG